MSSPTNPNAVAPRRSSTPAKRFTCFKRLPLELQHMIWDEALLSDFTILQARPLSDHYYVSMIFEIPISFGIVRHGHDPGSIALACQDAAWRWRTLFPLLSIDPTRLELRNRIRVREDMTIFLTNTEELLRHHLKVIATPLVGLFQPQHVAYLAPTWDYRRVWRAHVADKRFAKPLFGHRHNLIRVRESHSGRRSMDVVIKGLIRMVRDKHGPSEAKIFANGTEWMRRIRPKEFGIGQNIEFSRGGTQLPRKPRAGKTTAVCTTW